MNNVDANIVLRNKKADTVFAFLRDNRHYCYLSVLNRLLIITFTLIDVVGFRHPTGGFILPAYILFAILMTYYDFKRPGGLFNRSGLLVDLLFVIYFMKDATLMESPTAYLVVITLSTGGLLYGARFGPVMGAASYAEHVYFSGGAPYSLFHGLTFIIIGVVSGYIGELFNYLITEWVKDIRIMSDDLENLSDKYKVMLGIYSVSQEMGKVNASSQNILNSLLATLRQIPEAENAILRVVNGNKLVAIAHYGALSHKLANLVLRYDQGFSGLVANTEKPILFSTVNNNHGIITNLLKLYGNELDEEAKNELRSIKSLMSVPLKVDGNLIGTLLIYNTRRPGAFGEDHLKILSIMASQFALHTYNIRLAEKEKNNNLKVFELISKMLNIRDKHMYDHSMEVARISTVICEELKVDSGLKSDIYLAALVHDIGKIGVSDLILLKPGQLDAHEFEQIKHHPELGSELLKIHPSLAPLAVMVREHHERYDGEGYPDGLKGEDISIGARIISLADTFHARTSDRPYGRAYSSEEAAQMIAKLSGSQFDPQVVQAFLQAVHKGKIDLSPNEVEMG